MKGFKLGTVMNVEIRAVPSAFAASIGLWGVLSILAWWLLKLAVWEAILGGLLAVLLHWIAATVHQIGHAWAARRVGWPMRGIRLWFLLDVSLYPRDEGDLPAAIHIRRALGGPAVSFLLAVMSFGAVLLLKESGGLAYYLALFLMLDSFLIFFVGAFLPLGFTDGSTLLEWWPKR